MNNISISQLLFRANLELMSIDNYRAVAMMMPC